MATHTTGMESDVVEELVNSICPGSSSLITPSKKPNRKMSNIYEYFTKDDASGRWNRKLCRLGIHFVFVTSQHLVVLT